MKVSRYYIQRTVFSLLLMFASVIVCAQKNNILCLKPDKVTFTRIDMPNWSSGDYLLRKGPQGEVFMICNGVCFGIEQGNTPAIAFPPDFHLSDICWADSTICIFANPSNIFCVTANTEIPLNLCNVEIDHLQFRMGNNGLFIFQPGNPMLFFLSYDKQELQQIHKFNHGITDIKVENGENVYVANGKNIDVLMSDGIMMPLFKSSNHINAIEIGNRDEIYIGTDNCLYYYDSTLRLIEIMQLGVKQLLKTDSTLYVAHTDYSITRIDNIGEYNAVSDTIAEKESQHIKTTKGYELEKIITPDELHLNGIRVNVLPHQGLYGIVNNKLIGLDPSKNSIIEELSIEDSLVIDNFACTRDGIVIQSDTTLAFCDFNGNMIRHTTDTNQFSIEAFTDSTILLIQGHNAFEYNPITAYYKRIETEPNDTIVSFTFMSSQNQRLLITTKGILLKEKGKQVNYLHQFNSHINTAKISACGIFYGTDNGLFEYNTSKGTIRQLLHEPILKVLDDGDSIYIVCQNGTVYRISYLYIS